MSENLNTFRTEVRDWLEENCPQEMRSPMLSEKDACWGGRNFTFQSDAQRLWLERMGEKGWTAPAWPTEATVSATHRPWRYSLVPGLQ
jgi:acyl-CoA dehydrogenase